MLISQLERLVTSAGLENTFVITAIGRRTRRITRIFPKMRRLFLFAALLTTGLGSAVCEAQPGEPLLPSSSTLSRLGLERMWSGQATLNPERDKVAHIVLDEELIFVQSDSGFITGFDSETGEKKWATKLGRYDEPSFPAISNQDQVLVIVGPYMYGLSKRLGNTLWRLRLPGAPSTAPAVDDTHVYMGMLDGSIYAANLKKIRQLYQEQRLPQWSGDAIEWRYQAFKSITTQPVVTTRVINFASRGGSLYGLTTGDHKLTFQLETDQPIVAPLTRWKDQLFVASEDHSVYALNVENGKILWDFVSGLPIRRKPLVVDGDLYLAPERGGVYALNASNGVQLWWRPDLEQVATIAGGSLFATDTDRNLLRVDRSNGAIEGTIPLRRYAHFLSNGVTDRVYVATESGFVLAMRVAGRDFPVYHQQPDLLPIVPIFEPEEAPAEEAPSSEADSQ